MPSSSKNSHSNLHTDHKLTYSQSLASFIHHVFVVSSEGQYLLKLIENTHKMVPYLMMGKIFKYGNAATMLNAMVKLLLTKLSLTSLSNWAGITQNPYEGMNLLQR